MLATYVEPITPEFVTKIIERERPDALLPTMGGQTALNTALSLHRSGVLKKYGVEMIGARAEVIDKAEDRELFREAMKTIGLETPRSRLADAATLKRADREKYKSEIARIEETASDPDARAKALAEFEHSWAQGESARRRRYVEKGLIEALEAVQEI
jgi:carbamoyl-phosphate synthase large subunit